MSPSGLVSSFGAGGFGSDATFAARRGQKGDIVTLKPHVSAHLEADVIRFGYDEAVRLAALRPLEEGAVAGERRSPVSSRVDPGDPSLPGRTT